MRKPKVRPSKENCDACLVILTRMRGEGMREDQILDLSFVAKFLASAKGRLASEAGYEREKERRKKQYAQAQGV